MSLMKMKKRLSRSDMTPEQKAHHRAKGREWYLANTKKAKEQNYLSSLSRLYGLTRARYTDLYEQQFGLCAICNKSPAPHKLHVDHNHQTNQVRGLLCNRCNVMLQSLEDPIWLESAERYLKVHSV